MQICIISVICLKFELWKTSRSTQPYTTGPSTSSITVTMARSPAENSRTDLPISDGDTSNQSPRSSGAKGYLTPMSLSKSIELPEVSSGTNKLVNQLFKRIIHSPITDFCSHYVGYSCCHVSWMLPRDLICEEVAPPVCSPGSWSGRRWLLLIRNKHRKALHKWML